MSRWHGMLVRFLLFSLALSVVRTSGQTMEAAAEEDAACVGIEGNNDMYGLGIRIGAYLQSFALALAMAFGQQSYRGMVFTTMSFQLSMLVGVVYVTVTDGALEAAEAAVITIFTLCSSAATSSQLLRDDRPPGVFGRGSSLVELGDLFVSEGPPHWSQAWVVPFVKLLIELGTLAYSIWFWFAGLDALTHTPCTSYAFFFARVSLYGWLRVLMKILVVLEMVTHFNWLLFIVCGIDPPYLSRMRQTLMSLSRQINSEPEPPAEEEGKTGPQPQVSQSRKTSVFMTIYMTIITAFYIIVVELIIHWNHISGVYTISSVGQLIPFLTGLGGFLSFLLDLKTHRQKK